MKAISPGSRWIMTLTVALALLTTVNSQFAPRLVAAEGTDFTGTVLLVDPTAGKLALKKEGSGTRFTFVVNDKTQFESGLKSLTDVKKGDSLTVQYRVIGSQYVALKVMPKK